MIRKFSKPWLQFASATAAAIALWALAAVHGYAWQMIWLPAAAAGATWPSHRGRTLALCRRRLGRDRDGRA